MDKIPWYKSNTLRGLLVAVLAQVIAITGLGDAVSTEDAGKYVDMVLDLISLAATVYAGYARARQPTPPVSDAAVRAEQSMPSGVKR